MDQSWIEEYLKDFKIEYSTQIKEAIQEYHDNNNINK